MIFPKLYQPEKSQPKYRRLFSFSRPWPTCAYFLNGPNAAASIAPTLIRRWPYAEFTPAARHDKTVLSVSCLAWRCELNHCSERVQCVFSVGDSLSWQVDLCVSYRVVHGLRRPTGCVDPRVGLTHGCPLSSNRQYLSYGGCLEVKREYYQNCCALCCA